MPTPTELLRAEQAKVEGEIVGIKRRLYDRAMSHATKAEREKLRELNTRAADIRRQLTELKQGAHDAG